MDKETRDILAYGRRARARLAEIRRYFVRQNKKNRLFFKKLRAMKGGG